MSPAIPEYPSWWDEAQRAASRGGAAVPGGKTGKSVNALRRVGGVSSAKLHVLRG